MTRGTHSLALRDYEVRAILRGATQLRRPVDLERQRAIPDDVEITFGESGYARLTWQAADGLTRLGMIESPFGMPGAERWVTEPWAWIGNKVWYKADSGLPGYADLGWYTANLKQNGKCWLSAARMSRKCARLQIWITSIALKRLHDMTAEQAAACKGGVTLPEHGGQCFELSREPLYFTDCPACKVKSHFIGDWWNDMGRKAANKLLNTKFNPWVWAVDFERLGYWSP